MKATLFTLGAIATTVLAQDISGLPQCGQLCATNMLGADKAEELGCDQNDLRCLCLNKNFIYGIRDCSTAVCGKDEAEKVVSFGLKVCSGAGVAITTGSNGQPTGSSVEDSSSQTGSAGKTSATPSGDNDEDDDAKVGALSTIYSTATSDGTTLTTAVSTVTGDEDDAKSKVSSKVDDLESKVESVSSKVDSVSSKAEDAKSSATKSEGDESSTTSSGDEQSSETGNSDDDDDAASALVAGPAALVAAAVAAMLF